MKKTIFAGLALAVLAVPAFADGDPEKGAKVFRKCKACHQVGDDAKNRVGPILNGIVGSQAGANPEFKYSPALMKKAEEGLIWDDAALGAFFKKPRDFIPGTKMSFAGLRKDEEIANLIAYLATQN